MTGHPQLTAAFISKCRKRLLDWFADHGNHDLPWRRTHDPYAILVSEMMLQQTRVATVLDKGYFTRWMTRFPDFASLAAAHEPEVLRLWEGLGYYQRARNLHATARSLTASKRSALPHEPKAMQALPGIGPYTAAAVSAFAFNHPVAVLDGNVERVLARLLNFRQPVDTADGKAFLKAAAAQMLPPKEARHFNSALMEFGQQVCIPRAPRCTSCPLATICRARKLAPASLPLKTPRTPPTRIEENVLFAVKDGRILLQIETGRRRQGLWKLPPCPPEIARSQPVLLEHAYTITCFKVNMRVIKAPDTTITIRDSAPDSTWHPLDKLDALPMPAPFRRVIGHLLRENVS